MLVLGGGWDLSLDDSLMVYEDAEGVEEGIKISLILIGNKPSQEYEAIRILQLALKNNPIEWLTPGLKKWELDLDCLRVEFEPFSEIEWLEGKICLEPKFETEEFSGTKRPMYSSKVVFYLTPEIFEEEIMLVKPVEIQESLKSFKKDFPDFSKVGFIMMQFGESDAHKKITETIKETLASFNIKGMRSDDKQYHDGLFPNVKTYLYGCGFGIAVYERIEKDSFNPNVSLEVGYMLAMGKPICILKDKTLKSLHADLIDKLYKVFDPQDPEGTIPPQITKWLEDKGIIE
jgi:hypothetical protein